MHIRNCSKNKASDIQRPHVMLPCSSLPHRANHRWCAYGGLGLAMGLSDQVCQILRSRVGRGANSFSAPFCAIAIAIIMVAMPKNFGLDQHTPSFRTRASYRSFANLDLVGSVLIIMASFLIVTVLNETNLAFSWSSGGAIVLLILTGVFWIGFFAWEWYISGIPGKDPIFPKRWFFDRPWMGILM